MVRYIGHDLRRLIVRASFQVEYFALDQVVPLTEQLVFFPLGGQPKRSSIKMTAAVPDAR